MRVRLDVSYDGTDFSGWAAQPGRRTAHGTLEVALAGAAAAFNERHLRAPTPAFTARRLLAPRRR